MFILNKYFSKKRQLEQMSKQSNVNLLFGNQQLTYIGKDTIPLLADTSLQTEGQVVAADHDAAAEALLKRLHVWLDAWEVQPLDDGRGWKQYGGKDGSSGEERQQGRRGVTQSVINLKSLNKSLEKTHHSAGLFLKKASHLKYLCLRIQSEKLLSAFVPVDLIELVCLPDILHMQTNTHTVRNASSL